jgi:putative transcriptional regulator
LTFFEPNVSLSLSSKLSMTLIIRNRVKELRGALGLTQEELAQAAGVSRQSINSIERERYVPSLPLALLLARIFRCAMEQIFKLEGEP